MAVRMLLWIAIIGLAASCLGQQVNNMAANSTSCSSVRTAYRSRGFNDRDAPQQPISGKLNFDGFLLNILRASAVTMATDTDAATPGNAPFH
jgi:hypothetical protein